MPHVMCEIKGCTAKAEFDVNDTRPYIYHTAEDGSIHCAGKNPNNTPTIYPYVPKTATVAVKKARDHILQEYYGFKKPKKTEEEEEEEDNND